MKSVFVGLWTGAAASRATVFASQLQMVVDQITNLQKDYQTSLADTSAASAKHQENCRHEDLANRNSRELHQQKASDANLAAQTHHGAAVKANAEFGQLTKDLQRETSDNEEMKRTREESRVINKETMDKCDSIQGSLKKAKAHVASRLSGASDGSFSLAQLPPTTIALLKKQLPGEDDLDFDRDYDSSNNQGGQGQLKRVLDMISKIHDENAVNCQKVRETEANEVHNFQLAEQNFGFVVEELKDGIDSAKAAAASNDASSKEAASLATSSGLQIDSLTATIDKKAAECRAANEEAQTRTNELRQGIQACVSAISAISQRIPTKITTTSLLSATSLLQLASSSLTLDDGSESESARLERAQEYLLESANKHKSAELSNLALRVKADPFEKVKQMIKEMISTLTEQASSDATFKEQCDSDIKRNTNDLENLNTQWETSKVNVEKIKADSENLDLFIQESKQNKAAATVAFTSMEQQLVTQIAELDKELAEFKETQGVLQSVLQQFEQELASGLMDAAKAVISVVQVVETNILEQITDTEEFQGQVKQDLNTRRSDYKVALSATEAEISTSEKHLKNNLARTPGMVEEAQGNAKLVESKQKELETKQTMCNGGTRDERFASRKQSREEEIEDLRTALEILNGQE